MTVKKEWGKPELTVLVRSKAEESVLTGCKFTGAGGPDPQSKGYQCQNRETLQCSAFIRS
jgi:hypothetical protein